MDLFVMLLASIIAFLISTYIYLTIDYFFHMIQFTIQAEVREAVFEVIDDFRAAQ